MGRFGWGVALSIVLGGAGLCSAGGNTSAYQRGVTAYSARDYKGAEAALEEAVAASSDPRAWYFKGLAERAQDKHAEAQESIHQGAALMAAGHGEAAEVRRGLERVQGPVRMYLEELQSFYAKTHEVPEQVILAPAPTEILSQFVSTLAVDDKVITPPPAADAEVPVPGVIGGAPAYPVPQAPTCVRGVSCSTPVVSTSADGPAVVSGGCGSVVDGSGTWAGSGCGGVYAGDCGGWGWGGCRTRYRCGRWHSRFVSSCWGGSGCGSGSSCGGISGGCGGFTTGSSCGSYGCGSYGGVATGCGGVVSYSTDSCGSISGCGGGWGGGCGWGHFRARRACCW